MQILDQLAQLLLGALPTLLVVLLFSMIMRVAFFRPIERILAERSARTEGARKEAEAAQAAAAEKVKAYHEALKKARAEVYAEQEKERRAVLEERASLVKETRSRASFEIRAAKERIARETAEARLQLESETEVLGTEIARVILGRTPGPGEARGAQ